MPPWYSPADQAANAPGPPSVTIVNDPVPPVWVFVTSYLRLRVRILPRPMDQPSTSAGRERGAPGISVTTSARRGAGRGGGGAATYSRATRPTPARPQVTSTVSHSPIR